MTIEETVLFKYKYAIYTVDAVVAGARFKTQTKNPVDALKQHLERVTGQTAVGRLSVIERYDAKTGTLYITYTLHDIRHDDLDGVGASQKDDGAVYAETTRRRRRRRKFLA